MIKEWSMKISTTNKCNLKCKYCNDRQKKISQDDNLSEEEILEILKAGKESGIKKVHWTGGEPTVSNLLMFSKYCHDLGYTEQKMTTNGLLLSGILEELIKYKLKSVNISLDTFDKNKFLDLVGVDGLEQVKKSIVEAKDLLDLVKINFVIMKSNTDEIPNVLEFVQKLDNNNKIIIKFLELWKLPDPEQYKQLHVPYEELKKELAKHGTLTPVAFKNATNLNTETFEMRDRGLTIQISRLPQEWRCGGPTCHKLRVYSHGRTCDGVNLKELSYQAKITRMKELIKKRDDNYIYFPES